MTFECMKGPAARDARLSVRVPRALKKSIERRAAKEGRTVADTLIAIVEQVIGPSRRAAARTSLQMGGGAPSIRDTSP